MKSLWLTRREGEIEIHELTDHAEAFVVGGLRALVASRPDIQADPEWVEDLQALAALIEQGCVSVSVYPCVDCEKHADSCACNEE